MEDLIRDVAKSLDLGHKNIAKYRGDPSRIFVMGHSDDAQLAALLCIDDRYLKTEGVPFDVLKGRLKRLTAWYNASLPTLGATLGKMDA